MPKLAEKKECCGCAACYNACPKKAITMTEDGMGFLYPSINEHLCVNCHLCEKSCPSINVRVGDSVSPRAFVGKHKNDSIRAESTSGGIFSAISECVIEMGGVVFGAAIDEKYYVKHKSVQKKDDLYIFRNSKYVQSEIGNTYSECKMYLDEGRFVCFSGTPCQIHGLQCFLQKKYNNLITVDVLCRSVPSPRIFRKYIDMQKQKYTSTKKVVFRDKAWGYSYPTLALYDDTKCCYRRGSESDLWLRSFLSGLCDRQNCLSCKYQNVPRVSDITIWDCFSISKIEKEFDDDRGATSIMAWSETGKAIVQNIQKYAFIKEVSVCVFAEKIKREKHKKLIVNYEQLCTDLETLNSKDFFKKYRPVTLKLRLKSFTKSLLRKLRLIKVVRRVAK